jgi:hypothetical protein
LAMECSFCGGSSRAITTTAPSASKLPWSW